MSPYKKNKNYCPKRPSSDFASSDRAKAAVSMLKSSNTNSPALIHNDEASHQPHASPTLSSIDSDYIPTHWRALSEEVNHHAPPSPTLTPASSEECPLIDLSIPDDHAEPAKPDQNQFSDHFARLWDSFPTSLSCTDVSPANSSPTNISSQQNIAASPILRPSSRLSNNSASTADIFYTPVPSPTVEMRKVPLTTSGYVPPHLRVPGSISVEVAASNLLTLPAVPPVPEGISTFKTATESPLSPHLRLGYRLLDITPSSANTSSVSHEKSTPAIRATKAVSPHLRIENRLPAVTASRTNASLVSPGPEKSPPATTIIEALPPPHKRVANRLLDNPARMNVNLSRKPISPAKIKALLPHQKKLKPFPKDSLQATYIRALYNSWNSSSSWEYAKSLRQKASHGFPRSRRIIETPISPGVTIRIGELCNVMVIDLPACNINTFCINYTTKHSGCRNKKKCGMVHEKRLRNLYLKQCKADRQKSIDGEFSSKSLDISISNVAAKLEEITQGKTKSLMPLEACSQKTYASTTAAGLPPPLVAKKRPRKTWDQDELADWARSNLNPETVDKLMIPYILAGRVPTKLFNSPCTKDQRTFHQFGALPGEIRNKIWRFAQLKGSRDVKVRFTRRDAGNSIQPMTSPPPLLLVNRESRSLAQLYWSTTFDNFQNSCPASVYFHFKQDRLWIHNQSSLDLVPMLNLMKTQHTHYVKWISIPLRDYVAHSEDTIISLCMFKSVEQIWFVAGDSREDDTWVRQCPPTVLNNKMKHLWARHWKTSRHYNRPPKCHLEIIPALEARAMKIDGLCWL